jgi:hypothetical protein
VHVSPEGFFTSEGQVDDVPLHASAMSHSPAAARQLMPAFPGGCVQAIPTPSHTSRVQGFESSLHAVPADTRASAGQVAEDPVQVSPTSHSPADARQVMPALPGGCWQAEEEPSQTSRVQPFSSAVHGESAAFF